MREQREHDVLRRDARWKGPLENDADGGRDLHAHVARKPCARDLRRADPERETAERPGVRRVRVGPDDDLAGKGMALEDEGVADALARPVEPDALRGRELLLPRREGVRERQEAARLAFLRHDLAEQGQVIAKKEDGSGILHARASPQRLREACGRHRRDVFVGEAQVGPHEARVARRDGGHSRAGGRRIRDDVAREDLLDERHPPRRGRDGRGRLASRETRARVGKQPARFDHAPRDRVLSVREERERDLPPFPYALENREVGRQEHPEVDRVLAVDALEALRDEEADARRALRVRRLLAGRSLAAPPPGHGDREASAAHRVLSDRLHAFLAVAGT